MLNHKQLPQKFFTIGHGFLVASSKMGCTWSSYFRAALTRARDRVSSFTRWLLPSSSWWLLSSFCATFFLVMTSAWWLLSNTPPPPAPAAPPSPTPSTARGRGYATAAVPPPTACPPQLPRTFYRWRCHWSSSPPPPPQQTINLNLDHATTATARTKSPPDEAVAPLSCTAHTATVTTNLSASTAASLPIGIRDKEVRALLRRTRIRGKGIARSSFRFLSHQRLSRFSFELTTSDQGRSPQLQLWRDLFATP
jgi:hypothetical protein